MAGDFHSSLNAPVLSTFVDLRLSVQRFCFFESISRLQPSKMLQSLQILLTVGATILPLVATQADLVGTWSTKSRSVFTGPVRNPSKCLASRYVILTFAAGLLRSCQRENV